MNNKHQPNRPTLGAENAETQEAIDAVTRLVDGETMMNKEEALAVLDQHLALFVRRSYAELAAIIDHPQSAHASGPSGAAYQIEFNVFYDSGTSGDLRIIGSIDDGGWRAFAPLSKSEIMKPTGELV